MNERVQKLYKFVLDDESELILNDKQIDELYADLESVIKTTRCLSIRGRYKGMNMGEPDNPNNCATCKHKQHPDGGYCYMFRFEPAEVCAQHTSQTNTLHALRMQSGRRLIEDVIKKQRS